MPAPKVFGGYSHSRTVRSRKLRLVPGGEVKPHLGKEYAALLVDPGYNPPDTAEALPAVGGSVVALAAIKGQGPTPPLPPSKTVHFSGYEWKVRTAGSNRGGGVTSYDPANAWTDDSDALHLRMAKSSAKWTCAEVNLTRSLGYGLYRFVVRESSHVEPAAVLTMFTWDDSAQDNHREFDVEMSRWGDALSKNAQDWAARGPTKSTCGSWPRPTATWKR